MKKVNAMTEKQVKEFYNACPSGYGVEKTRVFDVLSLQFACLYIYSPGIVRAL